MSTRNDTPSRVRARAKKALLRPPERLPTPASVAEALLPAAWTRRLRVAKFRYERARFTDRVVTHRYGGHRLQIVIGSRYGERYDQDWAELPEVAKLKEGKLRAGASVFNLGANHGVVALMLAKAVGATGRVVALEAHPHDAALARRNAKLNQVVQLEILHAAVARRSGTVTFGLNSEVDDGTRRWGDLRVPAWSIDDLAAKYGIPDVVFIDVEGYEGEALAGARETLRARPDWFVEVHGPHQRLKYRGSVEEIVGSFDRAWYDLHVAADRLQLTPSGIVSQAGFMPIEQAPQSMLDGRFFLIALSRQSSWPP